MAEPDAIVIGAGPNGLSAAIVLAQAGRSVTVFEANDAIGGGARSAELTLPGFVHDVGSAVHPFGPVSPMFMSVPLSRYGFDWIVPPLMIAHPYDADAAAVAEHSLERTARTFEDDEGDYHRVIGQFVKGWPRLRRIVLGPPVMPRDPLTALRFGVHAVQPAVRLARRHFRSARLRGLFAGSAAHGMLPLERSPSAAFGIVLTGLAHVAGWVLPRGGAQRLSDALAAYLRSLGGRIVTSTAISSVDDLPGARAVLCDLSPRPLLRIAGHRFPPWYRRKLEQYRYGLAAFKVDWALDAPIPWRDPACARSGTVHLGGTFEEIAFAERETCAGRHPERPFVILAQPTLFDPSRAPAGRHTAWAYCHVPNGSTFDMLPRIEAQIERFAPGFRERVLSRAVTTPADLERINPNLVGGDIAAGATDWRQLFARPTWRWYSTPARGIYICSSSTPPGAGVHGMCGYFAARRALNEVLRG